MNNDITALPQLIDIGVNLTHDSFDSDRDAVIARARSAGVVQMLVTGASLTGSREAVELARARNGHLFATAGIHPHHARDLDEDTGARLADLALAPEVVAVGECGLDYFRDFSPRSAQRQAFERQLSLAARIGKPVFLHQRDAHDDFVAILREYRASLAGGVAHCFTAQGAELECYLELGLAIGITGWICDERRGASLVEAVRSIPLDRMMVETDGPFLLPRTLGKDVAKERRNEPAFLPEVVKALARATGRDEREIATETTRTARRLFGLR